MRKEKMPGSHAKNVALWLPKKKSFANPKNYDLICKKL